jgi:hypothetical protein
MFDSIKRILKYLRQLNKVKMALTKLQIIVNNMIGTVGDQCIDSLTFKPSIYRVSAGTSAFYELVACYNKKKSPSIYDALKSSPADKTIYDRFVSNVGRKFDTEIRLKTLGMLTNTELKVKLKKAISDAAAESKILYTPEQVAAEAAARVAAQARIAAAAAEARAAALLAAPRLAAEKAEKEDNAALVLKKIVEDMTGPDGDNCIESVINEYGRDYVITTNSIFSWIPSITLSNEDSIWAKFSDCFNPKQSSPISRILADTSIDERSRYRLLEKKIQAKFKVLLDDKSTTDTELKIELRKAIEDAVSEVYMYDNPNKVSEELAIVAQAAQDKIDAEAAIELARVEAAEVVRIEAAAEATRIEAARVEAARKEAVRKAAVAVTLQAYRIAAEEAARLEEIRTSIDEVANQLENDAIVAYQDSEDAQQLETVLVKKVNRERDLALGLGIGLGVPVAAIMIYFLGVYNGWWKPIRVLKQNQVRY